MGSFKSASAALMAVSALAGFAVLLAVSPTMAVGPTLTPSSTTVAWIGREHLLHGRVAGGPDLRRGAGDRYLRDCLGEIVDNQLFNRVPKPVFRSEVVDKQPDCHACGGCDRPHGGVVLAVLRVEVHRGVADPRLRGQVFPAGAENAITAHPRIKEAAVIGAWNPTWQERPVVLAVTDDGQAVPIEEIHQLLTESFATWQLPGTVIYVDALPRTSVGKLDKKAMRATYADIYRETASVAPS